MKKISLIIISFSIIASSFAQSQFSVDQYKTFLSSHQNMTEDQLLDMHSAGTFKGNINVNYNEALYFDSIAAKYNLTDDEKSLIAKNGFVVTERKNFISTTSAFVDIYTKDLPVFISSDALLFTLHKSYDKILKEIEITFLANELIDILNTMNDKFSFLTEKYSSNPELTQMLHDVDLYINVPRKLLLGTAVARSNYSDQDSVLNNLIQLINSYEAKDYKLFSSDKRTIDFSQFKPRGHYDDQFLPILGKYFKAMIWFGRIEIYLSTPTPIDKVEFKNIQRQIIDAYLFTELMEQAGVKSKYEEIEKVLNTFVGDQDNVTYSDLVYLNNACGINSANELLDSVKIIEFQDTLFTKPYAEQKILSQILYGDINSPEKIKPASAFLLFGQRFVIDSYVTGSVVYDKIIFNNQKICRLFPSSLDPMFALGNNAAGQLLKSELSTYKYSSNMAALKYLIDSYPQEYWETSIYNMWLNSIRQLNPPKERTALPEFMQTAAYWQEKLNTQLAAWTELRHDNILYAKQSYTGGITCSYPYGYVEALPEFYGSLNKSTKLIAEKLSTIPECQYYANYFSNFSEICDTLYNISIKELDGEEFSSKEINFLKNILYASKESYGRWYDGWYINLIFGFDEMEAFMEPDLITADIHTTPTDCGGGSLGAVKHVGTGDINLGVFISELPNHQKVAFAGPALSYHEFTTTNYLRLTDEEWLNTYYLQSSRPSWVNAYLADSLGKRRPEGDMLLTDISDLKELVTAPVEYLTVNNYPNPFNPSTLIRYTIPPSLTNSAVEIIIYNIQGEIVKRLLKDELPSGTYVTKWNGTNDNGKFVTSGIYLYSLRAGSKIISGKMTLIK